MSQCYLTYHGKIFISHVLFCDCSVSDKKFLINLCNLISEKSEKVQFLPVVDLYSTGASCVFLRHLSRNLLQMYVRLRETVVILNFFILL